MQTFIPLATKHGNRALHFCLDCYDTARLLDWRRLGNQRNEARLILQVLEGDRPGSGWRNHPNLLMWQGFISALELYYNAVVDEWVHRGYANSHEPRYVSSKTISVPPFWGTDIHKKHRILLYNKLPEHYGQLWDSEGEFNDSGNADLYV